MGHHNTFGSAFTDILVLQSLGFGAKGVIEQYGIVKLCRMVGRFHPDESEASPCNVTCPHVGAAGIVAVHIKDAMDKLLEYQGIQNAVVKTEGVGSLFRFIKVGLQSAGYKPKHEFENIIFEFVFHESTGDELVKLFGLFS